MSGLKSIALLIGIAVVLTFIAPDFIAMNSREVWLIRMIGVLFISIVVFKEMWFYRCNKCKNWFAMKESNVTIVGHDVKESKDGYNVVEKKIAEIRSHGYNCKYNCGGAKSRKKRGKYRKV